ncbi:MAG: U32 family peptidase, partial [Lachnospiraceae bacterium]|nr:U32 family peptidase [Lachnospiraceae bacterium]
MKNVEILAPAGNYDCFLAAVNAGADAVYLGGNMYGARAFAGNFCKEDLLKALDHAHVLDKKIYLTVNTLLSNNEIDNGLYNFIAPLYENGLDAVIVQDLGATYFLHENFKELPLHASTQMTITNPGYLNTLKENGFTRIVPARELSLNEIRLLSDSSDLEIECFVHGALCYCYSGQCMLSFSRGGRSGNKGRCAQPCRLLYETAGKESYYLSPKDLCVLDSIPDLIDAGIDSFKIEGRMKKPEYVANAAYLYKKWADRYLTLGKEEYEKNEDSFKAEMRKDLIRLSDMYNRGGFTKGFYYMHNGPEIMSVNRPNHYGTFVADVVKVTGKDMTLLSKEDINAHDVIEVRKNDKEIYEFTTGKSYNKGDSFVMNYKKGLKIDENCLCYRIRNNELIEKINDDLKKYPAKK